MTRQSLKRRDSWAFTLLELLIVLGVAVLIMGMAVPATVAFLRGQESFHARRVLKSAAISARSAAIAHRSVYSLEFKPSSTGQWYISIEDQNNVPLRRDVQLPRGIRLLASFPSPGEPGYDKVQELGLLNPLDDSDGDGFYDIQYKPTGAADEPNSTGFLLCGPRGLNTAAKLFANTGTIQVK